MKSFLVIGMGRFGTAVAQELTVATYNIRNANKGDAERGNG